MAIEPRILKLGIFKNCKIGKIIEYFSVKGCQHDVEAMCQLTWQKDDMYFHVCRYTVAGMVDGR